MPVQRILVSPKVSGMIVKLDILEGRRVRRVTFSPSWKTSITSPTLRTASRPWKGPAAAGRNRGHAA